MSEKLQNKPTTKHNNDSHYGPTVDVKAENIIDNIQEKSNQNNQKSVQNESHYIFTPTENKEQGFTGIFAAPINNKISDSSKPLESHYQFLSTKNTLNTFDKSSVKPLDMSSWGGINIPSLRDQQLNNEPYSEKSNQENNKINKSLESIANTISKWSQSAQNSVSRLFTKINESNTNREKANQIIRSTIYSGGTLDDVKQALESQNLIPAMDDNEFINKLEQSILKTHDEGVAELNVADSEQKKNSFAGINNLKSKLSNIDWTKVKKTAIDKSLLLAAGVTAGGAIVVGAPALFATLGAGIGGTYLAAGLFGAGSVGTFASLGLSAAGGAAGVISAVGGGSLAGLSIMSARMARKREKGLNKPFQKPQEVEAREQSLVGLQNTLFDKVLSKLSPEDAQKLSIDFLAQEIEDTIEFDYEELVLDGKIKEGAPFPMDVSINRFSKGKSIKIQEYVDCASDEIIKYLLNNQSSPLYQSNEESRQGDNQKQATNVPSGVATSQTNSGIGSPETSEQIDSSKENIENSTTQETKEKPDQLLVELDQSEQKKLLDKIVINGNFQNESGNTLTRELIEIYNLGPSYQINHPSGKDIYISNSFIIDDEGRKAVYGYVKNDQGNMIISSWYGSSSQGSWRMLPVTGDPTEFAKAYNENSINLDFYLQKAIHQVIESTQSINVQDSNINTLLFRGTTIDIIIGEPNVYSNYYKEVSMKPEIIQGRLKYDTLKKNDIVFEKPEEVFINEEGKRPDFNKILDTYKWSNKLYGDCVSYLITSKDGSLSYTYNVDSNSRVWISTVHNQSELSSIGVPKEWVDAGCLLVPMYEYYAPDEGVDQTGGYGNIADQKGVYVSMWENYLSKVRYIKEFKDIYDKKLKKASIEKSEISIGENSKPNPTPEGEPLVTELVVDTIETSESSESPQNPKNSEQRFSQPEQKPRRPFEQMGTLGIKLRRLAQQILAGADTKTMTIEEIQGIESSKMKQLKAFVKLMETQERLRSSPDSKDIQDLSKILTLITARIQEETGDEYNLHDLHAGWNYDDKLLVGAKVIEMLKDLVTNKDVSNINEDLSMNSSPQEENDITEQSVEQPAAKQLFIDGIQNAIRNISERKLIIVGDSLYSQAILRTYNDAIKNGDFDEHNYQSKQKFEISPDKMNALHDKGFEIEEKDGRYYLTKEQYTQLLAQDIIDQVEKNRSNASRNNEKKEYEVRELAVETEPDIEDASSDQEGQNDLEYEDLSLEELQDMHSTIEAKSILIEKMVEGATLTNTLSNEQIISLREYIAELRRFSAGLSSQINNKVQTMLEGMNYEINSPTPSIENILELLGDLTVLMNNDIPNDIGL